MSENSTILKQFLQETALQNIPGGSEALLKTFQSKNITVDEWNSLITFTTQLLKLDEDTYRGFVKVLDTLDKSVLANLFTDLTQFSISQKSCTASGPYSQAFGNSTAASSSYSHAEGRETQALGEAAHAEGVGTVASGIGAHAEGGYHNVNYKTVASGKYSHAEGVGTKAEGSDSHAEGEYTAATGASAHAEGSYTKASGKYSHAEGINTTVSGEGSHAEGSSTTSSGNYSHAEGEGTKATDTTAHAEGHVTTASGMYSHAEGTGTTASDDGSHAEGGYTTASGHFAHAEGKYATALGQNSHAEGENTRATGYASHAEGYATVAGGLYSHAAGLYTVAENQCQYVIGKYNASVPDATFIVGNGTDTSSRSNSFYVTDNGAYTSQGKLLNYPQTGYANSLIASTQGNVLHLTDISPNAPGLNIKVNTPSAFTIDDIMQPDRPYFLNSVLKHPDDVISYVKSSPEFTYNMLILCADLNNLGDAFSLYITQSDSSWYIVDSGPWGTSQYSLLQWTDGELELDLLHHYSGAIRVTPAGSDLILNDVTYGGVEVRTQYSSTLNDLFRPRNGYYDLKCAYTNTPSMDAYLNTLDWSQSPHKLLVKWYLDASSWVSLSVYKNPYGNYRLFEDNNTWGARDCGLYDWLDGTYWDYFGYITDQRVAVTAFGAKLILGVSFDEKVYVSEQDGVFYGVPSHYPAVCLQCVDPATVISVQYEQDINKVFKQLQYAIISMGGHI